MKNQGPFTSADLQRFIEDPCNRGHYFADGRTYATVPDAARALGSSRSKFIKSLVFLVKDEPLLVINNGLARVDQRKIAERLGVGRKQVQICQRGAGA